MQVVFSMQQFFRKLLLALFLAAPQTGVKVIQSSLAAAQQVHNLTSCPEDDPTCCITDQRLLVMETILSFVANTENFEQVSARIGEELYSNLTVPDALLVVEGVGLYPTPTDAAEYLSLTRPDLNGGAFKLRDIILEPDTYKCLTQDHVLAEDIKCTHVRRSGYEEEASLFMQFNFAQDSLETETPLIEKLITRIPDVLSDLVTSEPVSVRFLCETAAIRCPGELYPYKSLKECYEEMSRMPSICSTNANEQDPSLGGGTLQGDTKSCRLLHIHSAGLRPLFHCDHLRNVSVKCPADLCPAGPRMEEPTPVFLQEFNPPHALWIRILETSVACLFFFVSVGTSIWFQVKRRRSWFQLHRQHSSIHRQPKRIPSLVRSGWVPPSPLLVLRDVRLSWSHTAPGVDDTVVSAPKLVLGGCKITGIVGESGSGKTTFLRIIAGFSANHMNLSFRTETSPEIGYCPQNAEMWPKEMPVGDILLFSSMLNGVELAQFVDSFDHLGLTPFLHKQFGKLSGGQQLRVNLAAAIMRRNPSLILLDEPLAALDEKNAIAALQVLRNISVNHAFVMTVHQPSNTISGQFDRMLSFDAKHRKSIFETSNRALIQGNESDVPTDPDLTNFIPRRTFQAALILWHGQFYGFPAMEILTFLISVISAVLTALIARPGLIGYPVLTPQSVRIPLYASFMLFGITFITSFGVSIIYAMREKQIYENYTSSKSMKTWVYLLTSTFRSVFFGILQSFLWTVVGLPLMGLFTNTSDIIFVNTSLYGSIWTFASFGTSLALPVAFGAHAVMLLDVYAIFFSGIFSLYSMAYAIIRVLQYINPLFYVVASNAALLVQQFDPGCGATDHPGICAQPEAILEMNQIRSWTSLETQGILLAFYVLLFLIFWFKLAPRGRTAKGGMRDDDNSQTPVIRFARHLSIVVSERSVRTEDDIHPPLDEWEEVRQAANMLAKGRSMGRRLTLEDMLHSVNLVGISEEEKQLVGMEGEEEMVGMAEGEEEKIGIVKAREDTDRCKHDTSNLSLFG